MHTHTKVKRARDDSQEHWRTGAPDAPEIDPGCKRPHRRPHRAFQRRHYNTHPATSSSILMAKIREEEGKKEVRNAHEALTCSKGLVSVTHVPPIILNGPLKVGCVTAGRIHLTKISLPRSYGFVSLIKIVLLPFENLLHSEFPVIELSKRVLALTCLISHNPF